MELLTTREVAELKGCSERAVRKLIQSGGYVTEEAVTKTGTKRYMIPLSSLDERLQRKYYLKKGDGLPAHLKTADAAPRQYRAMESFSVREREQIEQWIRVLESWQSFRLTYSGSLAGADDEFIKALASDFGGNPPSRGTLYRKMTVWQEGNLEGLIDSRGKWKKGTSSVPKEIQDLFMYVYLDEHALTVKKCVEATRLILMKERPDLLSLMPECIDSFYRLAASCPVPVATLARHGEKAFNDRCGIFIDRFYDDMESNDYWIADGHTIDVISRSDDGENIRHRLTLSAFIDARSGIYVGWVVTDNPSSDATLLALRKAILRYGIPRHIYVDNGREYLNHDIGGLGHRAKKRKVEIKLPTPILTRLGIKMTNALPRNGQAKIIEREFKNFTFLSQLFDTYCGNTPSNRPEKLKYNLKSGMIPTDGELTQVVEDMIEGYFNLMPYNGKVVADRGKPRMEVYRQHLVTQRRAVTEDLNLMMMRSTKMQTIGKNGVHLLIKGERIYYFDDELLIMQGERVFLRYNPENLEEIRVYDENEAFIKTAPLRRDIMMEYGSSKQEISDGMAEKRRFRRYTKELIQQRREISEHYGTLNLLDIYTYRAKINRQSKLIQSPVDAKVVEIVRASELQELPMVAGGGDCAPTVHIDKARMIRNIERKGY